MGSEGGGIDLNFGTPEPVLWAIRSPSPRLTAAIVMVGLTSEEELRRSEKEVGMKKEELLLLLLVVDDEKEKVDVGYEFAEVSKLPEEVIREKLRREIGLQR